VDFNATQVAIRAGYSPSIAYSIGPENLGKPEIKAAVQAAQAGAIPDIRITKDYLIGQANDIMLKAKARGRCASWTLRKSSPYSPHVASDAIRAGRWRPSITTLKQAAGHASSAAVLCRGIPGTEQERSGHFTSYINRTG
jgi:hypothetical protein